MSIRLDEQDAADLARIPAASYKWYPNVAEYPQLVESLDPWARASLYKGIVAALAERGDRDPRIPCFLSVPQSGVKVCGTRAQLDALLAQLRGSLPLEYLEVLRA